MSQVNSTCIRYYISKLSVINGKYDLWETWDQIPRYMCIKNKRAIMALICSPVNIVEIKASGSIKN